MQKQKIYKKAFSLIELSIVILIISILITGALSVSTANINNAKIKVTNDRITEIYKALGSYLVINKKLPCPASLILDKTNASYGIAGTDGTCTASGIYFSGATSLVYGMVPVRALGISSDMAEDGFGNKIAYVVHRDFTTAWTSSTGGHVATAPYDPASSIILIKENPSGSTSTSYAIFALISAGANKNGAFNATSTTRNARSADADEMDNDVGVISGNNADFNLTLVSTSANSDTFDDVVFAKTRTQMVQDFNAYSVIPCAAYNPSDVTYGATNIVWPAGAANQVVVATTSCPAGYTGGTTKPTKKCGAFGVWEDGVVNPCLAL